MATSAEVLGMLIPNGGWIAVGSDYEGIEFVSCTPITKAEFEAGFAQFEAWKAEKENQAIAAKAAAQAKLANLGLNAEDLKALGL